MIAKFAATVLTHCSPRQAIQLLQDGIKPVEPEIDALLDIPSYLDPERLELSKRVIFAGLMKGEIPLSGCPRRNKPMSEASNSRGLSYMAQAMRERQARERPEYYYDERQEIPVEQIIRAGITGLNWEHGRLSVPPKTGNDGISIEGWEYRDLRMPTAKVATYRTHVGLDDHSARPIDLTGLSEMHSAGESTSPGAAATETSSRTAGSETFTLSTHGMAPKLRHSGTNRGDLNNNEMGLPMYMRYLLFLCRDLGPERIATLKKHTLEEEIKENWWAELGDFSEVLIRYMATILRTPEVRLRAMPHKKR